MVKQILKKHSRLLIVALCALMASANLYADSFEKDDIIYNINPDGTSVSVTSGRYYTGDITIPSTVANGEKTYSVTSIKDIAFIGCIELTSITIPNSVTNIGDQAFTECSELTSINIPNSVTSIGSDAFNGTPWYNNQPDGLVYAGLVAYKYKGTMPENTSITIKEGTKGITDYAFYDCSELTSINIPNSVTNIEKYAFKSCTGLKELHINNTTPATLGSNVFKGITDCTLYVPINTDIDTYKNNTQWNKFSWASISKENVFELTIGDSEYASVYLPFNAKASEGVTTYAATSTDGNSLHLEEVTDRVLAKEKGFIVKATAGKYLLNETEEAPTVTNSVLQGVTEETAAPTNCYVLGNESNTVGFYKYNGAKLGAYKAYLLALTEANAPHFIGFDLNGTTTGINQANADNKANTYYDLLGRRNAQPTKGLNIVNGKKVIK